jgi:hypothetical protein
LFLWTKIKLRTCLGALVLAKCIWYNLVNNLRRDVPWGQKCVTVHKRSGCYIIGNAYIQLFQLRLSPSKAEKSNTSAKGCWESLINSVNLF